MSRLIAALLALTLTGCYTLEERRLPELRAKAFQPICTAECHIEINVSEGDDNSRPTADEPAQQERDNDQGARKPSQQE